MALPALNPEPEAEENCLAVDDEPQGAVLRVVELDDGSVEEQELPLTMELLLHPQEGDKVTQTDFHLTLVFSVLGRLRRWLERTPGVGVFSDLRFDWHREGLKPSGPDIAVVQGLPATRAEISEQIGGTFDTTFWGVRPHLVIEVVSPEHGRLRKKDLEENVDVYARAGVEEYLVFNPIRIGSEEPLELLGFHLAGGLRYSEIQGDPQGRILSQTTGLFFWSDPNARRIEIFDQTTEKRLLTDEEEKARADAAEAALRAAQAEIARLKARESKTRPR